MAVSQDFVRRQRSSYGLRRRLEGSRSPIGRCPSAFYFIASIFGPIALPLVLSLQVANPRTRAKLRRPSWSLNPFDLKEPLQHVHLETFEFLAIGFGALLAFPFRGFSAVSLAIGLTLFSVSVWVGIRLCMVIFRKKMEDE